MPVVVEEEVAVLHMKDVVDAVVVGPVTQRTQAVVGRLVYLDVLALMDFPFFRGYIIRLKNIIPLHSRPDQ